MDLDQLLQKIAKADMDAFETLYQVMYGDIFAFILSILKQPAEAADLTQDTFLRIYAGASTYKNQGYAKTWMLKIARNLAFNHLKKQKHASLQDTGIEESSYAFPADSEARYELQALLQSFSLEQRQILSLKACGYTHKEIARILKRPESTIRWKYANAVKQYRALYSAATENT